MLSTLISVGSLRCISFLCTTPQSLSGTQVQHYTYIRWQQHALECQQHLAGQRPLFKHLQLSSSAHETRRDRSMTPQCLFQRQVGGKLCLQSAVLARKLSRSPRAVNIISAASILVRAATTVSISIQDRAKLTYNTSVPHWQATACHIYGRWR